VIVYVCCVFVQVLRLGENVIHAALPSNVPDAAASVFSEGTGHSIIPCNFFYCAMNFDTFRYSMA
jgi:hypothetical protein